MKKKKDNIKFNKQDKKQENKLFNDFMPKEGILAVWGAPGSGKTTTAVKLAKHIADNKKNVVLVMCDAVAPMIPCICPQGNVAFMNSIGNILSSPNINGKLIKNNMVVHKNISHLVMLGMLGAENEYTYAPYTKEQAEIFLNKLRKLAPYIIVDCSSYISGDILSTVALLESDSVLSLVNADIKSVSYMTSQTPLLDNCGYNNEKEIKIVANAKSYQSYDSFKDAPYILTHSDELDEQFCSGHLFDALQTKDGSKFMETLKEISEEVFGC